MDENPTLHSRRSLTLTFNVPIAKTRKFWEALLEGRFVTTKCRDCGMLTFPPQADCPACMGSDPTWVELGTDAELLTFTYVQITPTSFVDHDPYVVAIARLSEGVNVLAWLEGAAPETLRPGIPLRLEARKSPDGAPYYVFVKA